jgi:UDP-GlcNAc:undecaprenyl-phosphate GlcNAc-1-phosphate transferase
MGDLFLGATVFAAATSLSVLLVPMSRFLAQRLGVIDQPGPRKVHETPMPRMGGVAIFGGFTGTVLAGYWLAPTLSAVPWVAARFAGPLSLLQESWRVQGRLLALVAGGTCIFLVGLLDDVLGNRFPVGVKAAGQMVAAAILIASGVQTSFLPYEWMNVVATLFWLVGITNAFNMLDNMDGLSAGVAFVASLVFLINAWSLGEFFISLLLLAFMGSLLGFLFFNFNPARVFMGDCGSLFVGYVIGSLTLLERYVSHASSSLFPVLMPLLVLAIPLVDMTTVVVIRIRERRPIYVGDSRHLSHRLLSLGFSKRASVLFIYLATFCLGLGAVSLVDASPGKSLLILLQAGGFVALILILMFFERRKKPRSPAP